MATARASTNPETNGATFPRAENPLVSPKNIARVSRFQLDTVAPAQIDEYLARKATFATTVTVRYAEPVSQIWAAFIGEEAFTWMPTVKGAPYRDAGQSVGVGSRRLIVSSLFVGQEQYEIFVPAERLAFNISSASLPGLKSLVEDYRFTPTTTGGTELVWTAGITPRFFGFLPLRLLAPLVRPFLRIGMRGLGPLARGRVNLSQETRRNCPALAKERGARCSA